MKKITLLLSLAVFLGVTIFTSCEKTDENNNTTFTIKAAEDEAIADAYWNDIDADIDFASDLMENNGFKSVTDTCPMIIVDHPDSVFFPRTITIDYGDEYCETWHGQMKKGQVVIHITSPMHLEGSVRTVTLEDFYINDHHIEGIKTLTNNGFNDSGNMNFDNVLEGGQITFPDGAISTRIMNHNREWTFGIETPRYWWDNEWLIRGTASGTNIDGVSFNNEITTPVLVKSVCRFPVSGTIDHTITDVGTFVLDYGDGECDNIATITFGDETWEIILGRH
ncbi:MAG: hypothetical protein GQ527_06040 [Bacteroidales bacterium]|nr:hypothetical protein [Bacteroidales bacterium]